MYIVSTQIFIKPAYVFISPSIFLYMDMYPSIYRPTYIVICPYICLSMSLYRIIYRYVNRSIYELHVTFFLVAMKSLYLSIYLCISSYLYLYLLSLSLSVQFLAISFPFYAQISSSIVPIYLFAFILIHLPIYLPLYSSLLYIFSSYLCAQYQSPASGLDSNCFKWSPYSREPFFLSGKFTLYFSYLFFSGHIYLCVNIFSSFIYLCTQYRSPSVNGRLDLTAFPLFRETFIYL